MGGNMQEYAETKILEDTCGKIQEGIRYTRKKTEISVYI
jgi:hypothetical protein